MRRNPGPPLLILPGRERPHEIVLSGYAVAIGALYVGGFPVSTAAQQVLPGGWAHAYGAALAAGGVLTLLGSFWLSNIERGLDIERSGLLVLSGALTIYVGAVLNSAGWAGGFAGGMAIAWAWANVRRSVGITRDLAKIRIRRERGGELG